MVDRRALIVGRGRAGVAVRLGLGAGVVLLLVALLAVSATVLRPAGAVVPGQEFVVSDGGGDKVAPSVSGDLVVWEDKRGGNSDVYGKRLSPAGGEFAVVAHPADQRRPAVSGGFVVWEDDRGDDWDIYGKNLAAGADSPEIPIVVAPGDQRKPKISGKKVVWEDWRKSSAQGFDLDVYYKDLETDPEGSTGLEIPAPAGNQSNPAISGDTVVWEDDRTGEKNVYGKHLHPAADEVFPVGTGSAWQDMPAISGSLVVWRQANGNDFDIFGRDLMAKDLATGQVFQVTTNPSDQWSPAISGTVVVWADGRNGNSDTYGKDLATGREFRITHDASPQETPAIDGETVVWEDQRVGGGTAYGTWDIHGSNLDAAPAAPTGLRATAAPNGVTLDWNTSQTPEDDLVGYNVYRADTRDGTYVKLNDAPLPASTTSYLHETAPPEPGATFYYGLKAQDAAGSESVPVETSVSTPVPPGEPPEQPSTQPPVGPPAQPPVAEPGSAPTPPEVAVEISKPVVPVGKIVRVTIRSVPSPARLTVTIMRNGKVISRRSVAPNSRFAFKPTAAGKYTVKASTGKTSRAKDFRARTS